MSPGADKTGAIPEHHIRIDLEGVDPEDGYVDGLGFAKTVERIINILTELDRVEARDRKASFRFRVVDLGRGSPTHVTLEAVLLSPDIDRRKQVVRRLLEKLASIEAEETDGIDYEFLRRAGELSKPVGESLRSVTISVNGDRFSVDARFREHVARKLAPEETADGAIRGMMQYINTHDEADPVFCIYPDIGPKKVTCHFSADLFPKARSGIGQFVEVRGVLKYKAAAAFPHEIAVQEVDVLPSEDELPEFAALRGAFPDLTHGLTAEEYVRQIRDDAEGR